MGPGWPADGRTDGQADGRTDTRTHARTDGRTDGPSDRRQDGRTNGRADGRKDGRKDVRTAGCMNRPAGRVGRLAGRPAVAGRPAAARDILDPFIFPSSRSHRSIHGFPSNALCPPSTSDSSIAENWTVKVLWYHRPVRISAIDMQD